MPADIRLPLPAAELIPPAPEIRFKIAAAKANLSILQRLLRVAVEAEVLSAPAVKLQPAATAGKAVAGV